MRPKEIFDPERNKWIYSCCKTFFFKRQKSKTRKSLLLIRFNYLWHPQQLLCKIIELHSDVFISHYKFNKKRKNFFWWTYLTKYETFMQLYTLSKNSMLKILKLLEWVDVWLNHLKLSSLFFFLLIIWELFTDWWIFSENLINKNFYTINPRNIKQYLNYYSYEISTLNIIKYFN